MSSPKIVVFFLYNESTGAPLTGATPLFDTYKDDTGSNVAQPAITEVGGGAYKFTPVFPTNKCLVAVIDGGSGSSPRRQNVFLRPEDYFVDDIEVLKDVAVGKWVYETSGPDANRLILYKQDGSTVLVKFDMQDTLGAGTATDPYKRVPV